MEFCIDITVFYAYTVIYKFLGVYDMVPVDILSVVMTFSALYFSCQPLGNDASTGIIVPLYTDPGVTWDKLIEEKNAHKSVPIIAIINPDSGPGVQNSNYTAGVKKLQGAGILVLGYVYTDYAKKDISSATSEIDEYGKWYKVNGIFFDGMSNVHGNETYYGNLTKYVKSHDMSMTIGNPGIDTLPSYIGTVDNIVVYDNPGLPSISSLDGWHANFAKSNFSFVSFDVPVLDERFIKFASNHVSYMYITDKGPPNPWDSLPTYFGNLVSMMEHAKLVPHVDCDRQKYGLGKYHC
jgi:hypothetical protein